MAITITKASPPPTDNIPDYVRPMIEAAILTNFERVAKAFQANPSTDNWASLQNAMWARQALTSETTLKKAFPTLVGAGIGHWVGILRSCHEEG